MVTVRELRIEIEAVERAIEDAFFTIQVVALEAVLHGLQEELRRQEN